MKKRLSRPELAAAPPTATTTATPVPAGVKVVSVNLGNAVNDDKTVSGSVTTTGIAATAAHIHQGAPGANGGVLIPLTKNGDTFSVPPGAKLTDAQYQALQAGNLYVNVHSEAHKDGEIRAQLKP